MASQCALMVGLILFAALITFFGQTQDDWVGTWVCSTGGAVQELATGATQRPSITPGGLVAEAPGTYRFTRKTAPIEGASSPDLSTANPGGASHPGGGTAYGQ